MKIENLTYLLTMLITGNCFAAPAPLKDPIVLQIEGKSVKLSQIMPFLSNITAGNVNALSKEQLLNAIDMAKKMYVMQEVLTIEAAKQNYDRNPKFKELFERAKRVTATDIYMRETGEKFSEAELRAAYPEVAKKRQFSDYKISLLVVKDENTARLIAQSVSNGVSIEKLAPEKSEHRASAEAAKPGSLDFYREDRLSREFGYDALVAIKNLRVGEISKVVRVTGGKFAIIKLDAKRLSAPIEFNELKNEIKMYLANQKFIGMIEDYAKSGKVVFLNLDGKKESVTTLFPKSVAKK